MKKLVVFVCVVLSLPVFCGCRRSCVEIIAHCGSSYTAPENTMASVMLGWEEEADVEVDIRMSKNNRIVVIHDSSTKRTAGVDLEVSETTSHHLRQLDVGSFKSGEFAGEPIPFLEDIIETIPPGRKLYIEIKSGPETLPFLKSIITDFT